MNDKERLEEIKKHRNEADNSTDEYEFEKINFYNLHVDWLIEQALRVQELEKENKRLEDFIETIQNVHFVELQREKAENRRYREALEFYADEETYEPLEVQIGGVTKEGYKISKYKYDPIINTDKGKKARKALEGEE